MPWLSELGFCYFDTCFDFVVSKLKECIGDTYTLVRNPSAVLIPVEFCLVEVFSKAVWLKIL